MTLTRVKLRASELDHMVGFLQTALRPLVQELPPGDITIVPVGILTLMPVGAALLDAPPTRGINILPGLGLRPAAAPAVPDRALVVADPALRWADWEQAAVSTFFPRSEAAPRDASPRAILAALLPPYGVVHFACHATADPGAPLESRLHLPDGSELTVLDILQRQLPPLSLVVLSACETGVSDPYSLDEGIAFPAAFLAAADASVISTLWKVADLSTALLVLRFYWEWRHQKAPAALALARAQWWQRSTAAAKKCAFLEQEAVAAGALTVPAAGAMTAEIRRRSPAADTNPFRHPYYWAGFTYSGSVLVNEQAGLAGMSRTQEAAADYDQVLTRLGQDADPALRVRAATALVNKAVGLRELGRAEEAAGIYQKVVAGFGGAGEPELRELVATALAGQGAALGGLGRLDEAAQAFDDVVARFGEDLEPKLREHVAAALHNKVAVLTRLSRAEEAAGVYDQMAARFGEAVKPELRQGLAAALNDKGAALGQLGRWGEAARMFDQVVVRFSDAAEPELRALAATALLYKGYAYAQLGDWELAVRMSDQVVARFGEAVEPGLREPVARALVTKGAIFHGLRRFEEAAGALDEVVARFGNAAEPELREQVTTALRLKAESDFR